MFRFPLSGARFLNIAYMQATLMLSSHANAKSALEFSNFRYDGNKCRWSEYVNETLTTFNERMMMTVKFLDIR